MIASTIERNGASYRQGLVLGLTMAEALLLLVFCLLIAAGASLSHERGRREAAERHQVEAEKRVADSQAAFAELGRNDRITELLLERRTAVSPTAIDDLWKKLTTSLETIEVLEREGRSIDELRKGAEAAARSAQQAKTFAGIEAALNEGGVSATTKEDVAELIRKGLATRAAEKAAKGKGPGAHDWPPIINLSEAGGYYFAKGSAELTQEFERALRERVIPRLAIIIQEYQVDLIEVVGHTDEQQIAARSSNLDKELLGVAQGAAPLIRLRPADNAGLGLARALAITRVLSGDSRLAGIRALPMSGAQLIETGERLTTGTNQGDVKERRRIEIRVRKSVQ